MLFIALLLRQLELSLYVPDNVVQELRHWVSHLPSPLRQDILDRAPNILFNTVGRVTQISSRSVIPFSPRYP